MIRAGFRLGLKPAELWSLTMRELFWMLDGEHDRQDAEYHRTAWAVSYLLNVHLDEKHKVTPDVLLGKNRANQKTVEERKADHEALMKRFGV